MVIFQRFEVNRAVFFNVLTQGWSALGGIVTMLVITRRLTAVEQGFYYTFSSALTLQVLVELALPTVIIQVASHEWALLKRDSNGRIFGDSRSLSRLASLIRFALKWYAVCGLLVIVGLSSGGYIFFSARLQPHIAWKWPWVALCTVAGLGLAMSPIFSVIEGCNQVASIYTFRFVQVVLNSLAVITGLVLGMGLYSLPLAALIRCMSGLVFVAWKHRNFVRQILTVRIKERINWRTEVWIFQWRLGVSCVYYFVLYLFTPIVFYYQGPKVAGEMGMTLLMVSVVELLSSAWFNTRMPHLGILIARRQYEQLDRLFRKLFFISLGVAIISSLGVLGVIYWLRAQHFPLGERLLPLLPTVLLFLQRIVFITISTMAFYLRAHKQEPLVFVLLVAALLTAISIWVFGPRYGPTGVSGGFLAVTFLWTLPATYYVFKRCRAIWHTHASNVAIHSDAIAIHEV